MICYDPLLLFIIIMSINHASLFKKKKKKPCHSVMMVVQSCDGPKHISHSKFPSAITVPVRMKSSNMFDVITPSFSSHSAKKR